MYIHIIEMKNLFFVKNGIKFGPNCINKISKICCSIKSFVTDRNVLLLDNNCDDKL